MPKLLVLFYSRTGDIAALADAVAAGAESVRFTEVELRRLDDLAPAETVERVPMWAEARRRLAARYRALEGVEALAGYDAIVLGSPSYHGVMAAEVKHLLDLTGPLWAAGTFANTVGSAFTAAQGAHGGYETTLWSMLTPLASLGMILVPPRYTEPSTYERDDPPAEQSASAPSSAADAEGPSAAELERARLLGRRVAQVAGWVTHGLGHEHDHAHGHSHGHSHDDAHGPAHSHGHSHPHSHHHSHD